MRITSLNHGWTLDVSPPDPGYWRPQLKRPAPVPASVPGCVHLDLMNAGIIADPFHRMFETGTQWVDERDWTYALNFEWAGGEHSSRVLRFECLDTVCSVWLNGEQIAAHDNYFLPLEIEVGTGLVVGPNELSIRFESPVRVGDTRRTEWFARHGLAQDTVMFDERAFVRKPGYMSGWDWGPRMVGCGISGNVSLIEFDERISYMGVSVTPEDDGWFRVTALAEGAREVTYGLEPSAGTEVQEIGPGEWRVKGPLWWPAGVGDQPLHRVWAACSSHEVSKMIGLRTIELLREADEHGESFEFVVNGQRLWARGANWIPNDSFVTRVDSFSLEGQLKRYKDLNFNTLRVWGGGLYESEDFYDICDRLGILVWQDFPFACMYYPDDEPWQEAVGAEAEDQVRRLRHRASLALWCGNNENLAMWQQKWGGPGPVPDRYCGEHLYDQVLPEVVKVLDPQTPYIASSPIGTSPDESIPIGPERNVNIDGWGDSHYWDVWHGRGDWIYYTESRARFSSEFGFASSCSLDQWRKVLTDSEVENGFVGGSLRHRDKSGESWLISDPADPPAPSSAVFHHERTAKKWEVFRDLVELHYPRSETLEDWTYYSQLNQRDALRCGIEHYRKSDFCRGSLIWQANDCWPVMSWAVEDYIRNLKPAGCELQRLYADVMVSIDFRPGDVTLTVWASNDGHTMFSGELKIQVYDTVDAVLKATESEVLNLGIDSRRIVKSMPVAGFDANRTAICISLAEHDRWVFLAEPKEMRFGPIAIRSSSPGFLEVQGFVADLVMEPQEKPLYPIPSETRTYTGLNIELRGSGRPRSLAGYHEVIR